MAEVINSLMIYRKLSARRSLSIITLLTKLRILLSEVNGCKKKGWAIH